MVHVLYSVAAFTCALVVLILPARTRGSMTMKNPLDRAFLRLASWIVIFCVADGLWGITASDVIMDDKLLFIASAVFHLCAAITPLVWLYFVLSYLGNILKRKWIYIAVSVVMFVAELALLIMNFKTHTVFYVESDGVYCTGTLRQFLFYTQYFNYILLAVVALFKMTYDSKRKSSHKAVLAFVAAPILCGVLQLMYPDAPAYSIGYMLGCCIIYSFVITEMLEKRIRENAMVSSANEAKTSFLFNMSHDIRTPINAVTGFTVMAKKYVDDKDRVMNYLNKIDMAGHQLLMLINHVLEMSRIESGKVVLSEGLVNIKELSEVMTTVLTEQASLKGLKYNHKLVDIKHFNIISDEVRINQIVLNLVGNAIKYTPEGGNINCFLREIPARKDGYATFIFTVEDTGIGMSKEFLEHIFEPFSREQTSTVSHIQGTGLGLSIVKNLVDLMGGTIEVQSEPGKGTRFDLTIDFKIGETIGETSKMSSEKQDEQTERINLKGKKVLLVEDNELNREIARFLLEDFGMEVFESADGQYAVEEVQTIINRGEPNFYDFILMDIQMPLMDGYEVTHKIRNLGCHIPIISLSANAFEEDRKKSLDAGMDGHIAKPIDVSELMRTLAKFL